jgi:nicotinamidase/pyrazinamidase
LIRQSELNMDALLIIDFQNDFTPGGALAVDGGDLIADPIRRLAPYFDLIVATRDWHPPDHGSFRGVEIDPDKWEGRNPAGIWPVHCVAGSDGAQLHSSLEGVRVDVIVDKGQSPTSQGYSGFQGTDLAGLLRERGVTQLYVAGLATDYCVKNTVLDGLHEGFEVKVVSDAVRGVDVEEGDSERALEEIKAAGGGLVSSNYVAAALSSRRSDR